MAADN